MTISRRIEIAVALIAAIAAVFVLTACGGDPSLTVHGTLEVTDFAIDGDNCQLSSTGYADIAPGAQVTVSAPDGTVLGSGALGDPKSGAGGITCDFPFTVKDVQGGEARYGVAVGKRGTVWFGPGEVAHAALSLGS